MLQDCRERRPDGNLFRTRRVEWYTFSVSNTRQLFILMHRKNETALWRQYCQRYQVTIQCCVWEVYVCVPVYTCVWHPEIYIRVLLYHPPPYFLRQSLTEPGTHGLANWLPICSRGLPISMPGTQVQAFSVGADTQSRVLMFVQQTLTP